MNAAQDDYQWWRSHGYTPASGKPLHLTISDDTTHPIFFDDNIHRMADDSIVAVRARQSPSEQFAALSGEIHDIIQRPAELWRHGSCLLVFAFGLCASL